jgi:glycosyltransferase involved in cell wall biosynthesis
MFRDSRREVPGEFFSSTLDLTIDSLRTEPTMRILMLTRQFYPWAGGTERQAQKLSRELIRQGVDVKVVTGWWFRGTCRREVVSGITVDRVFTCWQMFNVKRLRRFGDYLYMLTLSWYLWRQRRLYDLIHIHMINYHAIVGVLAGRLWGKKTLVKIAASGRDGDLRRMGANRTIPGVRWMLPQVRHVDCAVSLNSEARQELLDAGFSPEIIISIPNGIDVRELPTKQSYSLHGEVGLVFVGRLHPQKNVDRLLRALALLIERHPTISWRLQLLGEGFLRGRLEELARQLAITDRLTFVGKVENVSDYLAESDIFVLPSRAEGMSNALLEAMAYGLPCVATDIPGNDVLIDDETTGLLVPVDDPEALANAIGRLHGSQPLRERLGRAAAMKARRHFAIDQVARQYIQLYSRLLNEESLVLQPATESADALQLREYDRQTL